MSNEQLFAHAITLIAASVEFRNLAIGGGNQGDRPAQDCVAALIAQHYHAVKDAATKLGLRI